MYVNTQVGKNKSPTFRQLAILPMSFFKNTRAHLQFDGHLCSLMVATLRRAFAGG